ncbi:MAG: nicotinate-nucleotide--dimethylbenzimidazole phosphoribosyltransferase [Spirochaetaceae bacterium]|jgi:nicotinate-nucleotide--dimethylbenzimidazole phosphoribosyltransferase|nr:nicotinate-nucleotide--dimethylbenzimidazole phosphoribosyltransferase [Spirochaetaceae bacterium]
MKDIKKAMEEHLDDLTKPRGSLGKLETYCVKMAEIQQRVPPEIKKKGIYVFAGDHGIASCGVSLYPQEVTRQMALNILAGGAGINALAGGTGWEITLVDAGIMGDDFPPDNELKAVCSFVRARIGRGTKNSFEEAAMTAAETEQALDRGRALAEDAADRKIDLAAIGDLGIGNTTTAAAMLVAAGFQAEDMVDRGTGIDSAMLEHKRDVVREAVKRRNAPSKDGKAILQNLGSFDFAMMAGFILGLENKGIGCVLDGFPVTAAAYMAYLINLPVRNWLFAGHLSKVVGHRPLLNHMGLDPVVDLDMRLGEGTGAVIGGHIVELGVKAAREMASFSSAHVSDAEKAEEKY